MYRKACTSHQLPPASHLKRKGLISQAPTSKHDRVRIEEYRDDESVLVAEVDCEGNGKAKCKEMDVKSYPAVKLLGLYTGEAPVVQGHSGEAEFTINSLQ